MSKINPYFYQVIEELSDGNIRSYKILDLYGGTKNDPLTTIVIKADDYVDNIT